MRRTNEVFIHSIKDQRSFAGWIYFCSSVGQTNVCGTWIRIWHLHCHEYGRWSPAVRRFLVKLPRLREVEKNEWQETTRIYYNICIQSIDERLSWASARESEIPDSDSPNHFKERPRSSKHCLRKQWQLRNSFIFSYLEWLQCKKNAPFIARHSFSRGWPTTTRLNLGSA